MDNNKPNVLIVDNSVGVTGAAKAIAVSAVDLKEQFNFFFVIPQDSTNEPWLRELGFEVFKLPFLELRKSPKVMLKYYWQLRRNAKALIDIAEANNIDIVHTNDLYNLSPIRAKKMRAKFKLITHIRLLEASMPSKLYRIWKKMHKKHATAVICNSNPSYKGFTDVPQAVVIHDKHMEDEMHPAPTLKEEGMLKIMCLSNYIRGKGQDISLNAFEIAAKATNNIELHFYGGDLGLAKNREFKQSLVSQAKAGEFSNRIFFHDHAEDIEQTMKAHDIVLNCSEKESFSRVCQEALFYGVPLISTDSGGPSDQITNGENGILIPSFNPSEIAKAIEKLANDFALRTKFSAASRVMVRERFGIEQTSNKIGALYSELLR